MQTVTRGRRGKSSTVDVTKDLLAIDGVGVDLGLDLVVDIDDGIDADLIEDTDDLDEGLNDIPDVLSSEDDL
jgi:hypothetical protein